MADGTTTPISFLREAIRAVPAVKWALGVGGIMAVIAVIYSFQIDARVAVIGTIIMLVFMTVLVVFARVSALANSAIALPALVFTWFTLLVFMAVTLSLFTSVFFQRITGTTISITSDLPLTADSGWREGGSSPAEYCASQQTSLRKQYKTVEVVDMKEDHKSAFTPFKHDYYRYQCFFRARS